uniref:Aa_trans domain-containing protein n=1 Tax=Bursaphelenchus xylophilus TaxID=6326 RepID=A0A1I7SAX5_BURXY
MEHRTTSYRRTLDPYPSESDIYKELTPDDFNFLEDRQLNEYAAVSKKRASYRPSSSCYRPNIWSVLNVIQIFIAILLLIFAFFRFFRIFGRPNGNILLDFIKAEDYAQSNQDGTEIISIKLGASLFVPCCLQLISGFSGVWPGQPRSNYGCLIVHVIFSMFAIVYWFEPITYAALELNLRNVQLENNISSLTYHILLVLLVLTALMVLVVTSLSMCNAILVLSEPCNIVHSPVDVHLGMASVILSIVCSALGVYVSASTLTSVTEWAVPSVRNIAALYGFGLRELIICSYITLATGLCSASTMIQQRNLRLAALVLQIISLFLIFGHMITADRITAVTHNMKTMFSVGLNRPIGPESLLLLYTFISILTVLIVAHTISTILALCKNFSDPLTSSNMYSQQLDEGQEHSAYHANI